MFALQLRPEISSNKEGQPYSGTSGWSSEPGSCCVKIDLNFFCLQFRIENLNFRHAILALEINIKPNYIVVAKHEYIFI